MDDKQLNKGIVSDLHESPVPVGEKITIIDLNDDCLECIFEYVSDLSSQIQITKCCQRFCDVMVCLWRRQQKLGVLYYPQHIPINDGDFGYYLTLMRTEFRTIKIVSNCTTYSLAVIRTKFRTINIVPHNNFLRVTKQVGITCFPCVETVYVRTYDDNVVMHRFSPLVPNLKYLYMDLTFIGLDFVKNFQYLEELHFDGALCRENTGQKLCVYDISLNPKHLKFLDIRTFLPNDVILGREAFAWYEDLKLDWESLISTLEQVLHMPQLKQLNVRLTSYDGYYGNCLQSIFQAILKQKVQEIPGIPADFWYRHILPKWVKDFCYLLPENITFLASMSCRDSVIDYTKLKFPRLEILCLRDMQLEPMHILEMLRLCPVLKRLDISGSQIVSTSLLKDISNYWQKENRNQVLCLYYKHTDVEIEIEENKSFWAAQQHLKLIHGRCDLF